MKNKAWKIQFDRTTGKERDDWWYLYCKEHNYPLGTGDNEIQIAQPAKPGGKTRTKSAAALAYYDIENAIDMLKDYDETPQSVASFYGIAKRSLLEDVKLFNDINNNVVLWKEYKAWQYYGVRFGVGRIMERLDISEEKYRSVILQGKAGKYNRLRK